MPTDTQNNRLEEYKALRDEVSLSLNSAMTTVKFLAGALAGLAAFGLTQTDELLRPWMFAFLIPVVSILGTWIWLGELHRLRRASFFLCNLEQKLGLKWESGLGNLTILTNRTAYISGTTG